jgi:putative membrane protein
MALLADYLAAERTFLAWIRTALSLMGFGFVVARFGLFLRELQAVEPHHVVKAPGLSLWFGTALIGLGIVVSILSSVQHIQLIADLQRGSERFARPSRTGVIIAILLAILGAAMAFYLMTYND